MVDRRLAYVRVLLGRIWKFLAVFAAVNVVAALGFDLLNHEGSLLNSFYWMIVTLSTVGYGDVTPVTTYAKGFTIGVLYTQIFLGGYLLSVIVSVVGEEANKRQLGTLGTDMRGHVVVLGWTAVGRAAVRELLLQEQTVAVVSAVQQDVPIIRALAPERQIFATYGPAAEREVLERVNVPQAHSVLICSDDDTANLIAALNVRVLAPHVRIVVSVGRPELKQTLEAAGVTYVATSGDLAGRLCADAAFRPDVANAIEDITAAEFGADLTEYVLTEKTPITHGTVGEAEKRVREASGCLVVGYARKDTTARYETIVNPPPTDTLHVGDALLIIGNTENLKRLHRWIGVDQGR